MVKKKRYAYPSGMVNTLQGLGPPSFEKYTKREFLRISRLHPDKAGLISNLFQNVVSTLQILKAEDSKKLTTFMNESPKKTNLVTLNEELSSYENGNPTEPLNTLLLKILGRELMLREKAAKPFWNDQFKDLSQNLWLPETSGGQGSASNLSKRPLPTKAQNPKSLTIKETFHSDMTTSQSVLSAHVDKWVNECKRVENSSQLKSLVIKIDPTPDQREKIDYDLQVSNFVYNKTVRYINECKGTVPSKFTVRDQLVTQNSRKGCVLLNKVNSAKCKIESMIKSLKKERSFKSIVKAVLLKRKWWRLIKIWYDHLRSVTPPVYNDSLKEFEVRTHKSVRTGSVNEALKNYDNCRNAVKAGRIKFFRLKYRSKKKNGMSMLLSSQMFKLDKGRLRFTAEGLADKFIRMNPRSQKKLANITSLKDSRLTKKFGVYRLHIPLDVNVTQPEKLSRVVGIDPGVTTFLSAYAPDRTIVFKQTDRCGQIDMLRQRLKQLRKDKKRKRIKRKLMTKLDLKQKHIIDELHWKSANYLVKNYDVIFIEKFDSQGFVKNGKSKKLNRDTNNHKPYQFRQRLEYKASTYGKIVEVVQAHNTTKTCSNCGSMKKMTLADRVYVCKSCNQVLDRDFNAAKNIMMKGLLC